MSLGDDALVIVGAGQAGAWAARTLREAGHIGRIVLCGAEPHSPYERPPLSKGVLSGTLPVIETEILSAAEMDERGIEFLPNTVVHRINRERHLVHCSGGLELTYSRLLLCTGGRPLRPAIAGADLPGVYALRTIDDALSLQNALVRRPRVVIIGGGWIGLEVAATARGLGCEVQILEAASRLCARSVMPAVSERLARLHEAAGVRVCCNARVEAIAAAPGGDYVLSLGSGEAILADLVLLAAGMVPNDELARDAGLECDRGVCVDAACRSSDPSIFAAGDVAVFHDARCGMKVRLESWQNAQDQGSSAARAMLGQAVNYRPLPLVWSEQYKYMVQIAGYPSLVRRTFMRPAGSNGILYLGLDEQEKVAAAVGLNAGRDFRLARKWIEQADAGDFSTCVEVSIAPLV